MLKADEISGNVLFEEKQKFPNWLTILIAGIILLTIAIALITGYSKPQQERNEMWIGLAVAVPVEILIIFLFQNVQLEKIVTSNGLYFRWMPWQRKFRMIERESIKNFEVRNSPPLNYGIHWFPGYGWVHNATAGEGIQLYLMTGRKIFFSTSDITRFSSAIENITDKNAKPRVSEF